MVKKKISEVTELIKRGITPKYVENDGILVINQKCIRDNRVDLSLARLTSKEKKITEEKFLNEGDILINSTGTGTLGRTAQINNINESITVDTHVTIMRPSKDINAKFLGYFIRLNESLITSMGKGATNQIELSATDLANIDIYLPGKNIQDKIVKILSAYDNLIENNLKRIKLLEESAELLYKEWFVNFRYPGYHNKKLIKGIPEGWNKVCISQFADISNGYAFKSKDFNSVGDKIIKIKNISDNSIDTANCDCVSSDITEKLLRFEIKEGDILIAMTGATVGKSGMMPRETERYFLNQRVGRIKSNIDIDISAFIYYLIKSDYVYNSMVNIAKGSAQPNISTTDIGNIQVTFPTKDILVLFEERVSCMFKSRLNLIAQNQKLKEARDILIPKLITGEIEV